MIIKFIQLTVKSSHSDWSRGVCDYKFYKINSEKFAF